MATRIRIPVTIEVNLDQGPFQFSEARHWIECFNHALQSCGDAGAGESNPYELSIGFGVPMEIPPIEDDQHVHDFGDGNGPVPARRHNNGDGGWVAKTVKIDPSAQVGVNAVVFGNAIVEYMVSIEDYASVSGNAHVKTMATIKDHAVVTCGAVIEKGAIVKGYDIVT